MCVCALNKRKSLESLAAIASVIKGMQQTTFFLPQSNAFSYMSPLQIKKLRLIMSPLANQPTNLLNSTGLFSRMSDGGRVKNKKKIKIHALQIRRSRRRCWKDANEGPGGFHFWRGGWRPDSHVRSGACLEKQVSEHFAFPSSPRPDAPFFF